MSNASGCLYPLVIMAKYTLHHYAFFMSLYFNVITLKYNHPCTDVFAGILHVITVLHTQNSKVLHTQNSKRIFRKQIMRAESLINRLFTWPGETPTPEFHYVSSNMTGIQLRFFGSSGDSKVLQDQDTVGGMDKDKGAGGHSRRPPAST
jgi:hypothetical protein